MSQKIPQYQKEIEIFKNLAKRFNGETKSFVQVFAVAKIIRIQHPFELKPYNKLTKYTQQNFENRLARFLGSTLESANFRKAKAISSGKADDIQAKVFNIENVLGKKCTDWVFPISPVENISPQVKQPGQKFKFPILNNKL